MVASTFAKMDLNINGCLMLCSFLFKEIRESLGGHKCFESIVSPVNEKMYLRALLKVV